MMAGTVTGVGGISRRNVGGAALLGVLSSSSQSSFSPCSFHGSSISVGGGLGAVDVVSRAAVLALVILLAVVGLLVAS